MGNNSFEENLTNNLNFLNTFRKDISKVEQEIPEVIESLRKMGEELEGMSEVMDEQLDEIGSEVPKDEAKETFANANKLEQAAEKINKDIDSEISHVMEFINHLKSLEQGALQAENIVKDAKKSI